MAQMTIKNERSQDTVAARFVPAGTLVRYPTGATVYMALDHATCLEGRVTFISLESGRCYDVANDKYIRPLKTTEKVTLENTCYNLGTLSST